MATFSDIQQAYFKLTINEKQLLGIFLSSSGSINRSGNAELDGKDTRMFMGRLDGDPVAALFADVDEKLLELAGRYTLPDQQGDQCQLTIALEGENLDTGFEFNYGSESDGPPEEIYQLVDVALDLTEEWYQHQLDTHRKNKR